MMETNNNKYECYQHFKNIFFLVLSRIAMHSIRYGLLLPMWRGLYVRVCLSVCLSVGHNRKLYKWPKRAMYRLGCRLGWDKGTVC